MVSSVKVKVRIAHTFDGDLQLTLISPTGISIPLSINRDTVAGGGHDYGSGSLDCSGTYTVFDDSAPTSISAGLPPFAGSFRPQIPLAGLAGTNVNGMWILHVADTGLGDVGTMFCVTLDITRQPFACCGATGAPQIVPGGPAVLTAENFTPPNNAVDTGEMVTVSLPLLNNGNLNTGQSRRHVAKFGRRQSLLHHHAKVTARLLRAVPPFRDLSHSWLEEPAAGLITATLQRCRTGRSTFGTVNYVIPKLARPARPRRRPIVAAMSPRRLRISRHYRTFPSHCPRRRFGDGRQCEGPLESYLR